MRPLTVTGLSADGLRLVLRSGDELFEVALADVPTSRQQALPFAEGPPPSPREIQQRIRLGETSDEIARRSGMDHDAVARYEGPVLAEREHQAGRAQRALVDGRRVGELVEEHVQRMAQDPAHLVWDAWLVEGTRWEVRASAGREVVRLRWDTATQRVHPLDEAGRQALRLGPVSEDALGAVLRPVQGRATQAPAGPASPRPVRPRRAAVPAWGEIAAGVSGLAPGQEP